MRSVTKFILLVVSVLFTSYVISWAVFTYSNVREGEMQANKLVSERNREESIGELYDLNGSQVAGAKVVSLIKKYMDPYDVWIKVNDTDSQSYTSVSDAVAKIDTTAVYTCKLQSYDPQARKYSDTNDVSMAVRLYFELTVTRKQTKPSVDYSSLLDILNKHNADASSLTQDDVDTLANYITLLRKQNSLLEQNSFSSAQGILPRGTVWIIPELQASIANEAVDFIPTDLIVWDDAGNGKYCSFVGIAESISSIDTGISGVTVSIVRVNSEIQSIKIINNSDKNLNVKMFRVSR